MKKFTQVLLFFGLFLCLSACHLNQTGDGDTSGGATGGATTTAGTAGEPAPAEKWLYTGTLDLTNAGRYRDFLREYKKCDPCTNINYGPTQCKHFDSKADITIEFEKPALPARAILTIKPYIEKKFIWPIQAHFGFCSHVSPLTPIKFKGKARYWNNYEGFHVQFTSSADLAAGGLGFVTVRSEGALPGDYSGLNITLYYGGSARESNIIGTADLEDQNRDSEDDYYGGGVGGR